MNEAGVYLVSGIAIAFGLYCIHLISKRHLPKSAQITKDFPRQMWEIFKGSISVIFRQKWIWGPVVLFTALSCVSSILMSRNTLFRAPNYLEGWRQTPEFFDDRAMSYFDDFRREVSDVGPTLPVRDSLGRFLCLGAVLVCALHLLRRRGEEIRSGLSHRPFKFPPSAWIAILIAGAAAGAATTIPAAAFYFFDADMDANRSYFTLAIYLAPIFVPVFALLLGLYLNLILRALQSERVSLPTILRAGLRSLGPLTIFFLIPVIFGEFVIAAATIGHNHEFSYRLVRYEGYGFFAFGIATALVPVIIVYERLNFRSAFMRFVSFVWSNLLPYACFVMAGAFLFTLPLVINELLLDMGLADRGKVQFFIENAYSDVMRSFAGAIVTVMCVKFYLARAAAEPAKAENVGIDPAASGESGASNG